MQDMFDFFILGVGRLREDQLIYVETRENVFFIIWDRLFPWWVFVLSLSAHLLSPSSVGILRVEVSPTQPQSAGSIRLSVLLKRQTQFGIY